LWPNIEINSIAKKAWALFISCITLVNHSIKRHIYHTKSSSHRAPCTYFHIEFSLLTTPSQSFQLTNPHYSYYTYIPVPTPPPSSQNSLLVYSSFKANKIEISPYNLPPATYILFFLLHREYFDQCLSLLCTASFSCWVMWYTFYLHFHRLHPFIISSHNQSHPNHHRFRLWDGDW